MPILHTTLEQWSVLRTVVDAGSFASAAGQLNRSQSSVSYAINQLQERLGIALLQTEGRSARLTAAGQTLLAEVTPLIEDMRRLEARGRSLSAGHEARVRLLVDSLFPRTTLFAALADFRQRFPAVDIELQEQVRQVLPEQSSSPWDLAVGIWDVHNLTASRLFDIELLAVADKHHPLHQRGSAISRQTLLRHLMVSIVRQDGHPLEAAQPANAGHRWQVNTVEAAVAAVSSGLCYGWLPRHLIADLLASGQLVPLALTSGARRLIPLCLNQANPASAGIATRTLADLLLALQP